LRSLSEVRLVRRITPAALRTLGFREPEGVIETDWSERLTIYSDGRINVNTADPFLLRQLSEELADLFIQDLINRRKERPVENLAELKLMPGMTEPLYNKLAPSLTVQSRYFSVTAEASSGRVRKRLTAVLETGKHGATLLYWRIR
jgi:general secretion pathway protein K